MPTLDWTGKQDAIHAAEKVPYRLLERDSALSCGDDSGNLIVHADNLEAMKALLPFYRGRVRCAYIDPPYNTRSAFEHYNDNLEHSTWLSLMYPRLELLKQFLTEDGAIFISIDDNEQAHLKIICDEIFGASNFVAQCPVKRSGGRQDSKFFAVVNEYLICYARNAKFFTAGEEVKTNENYPRYDAERGRNYKTQLLRKWGANSRREDRPNLFYPIPAPDGSELYPMLSATAEGRWRWGKDKMQQAFEDGRVEFVQGNTAVEGCWRWSKNKMQQALDDGLIEFVQKNGTWVAYEKIYEPIDGEARTKKFTTWIDDSGSGAATVKKIFGDNVFAYPKAVELIERVLKMGNVDKDSLVLDAYAGSGTTAHAVLNLNAADGGNRRFILIERENFCETITAERVRRVGGAFDYYRLGEPLFTATGALNPAVTFEALAAYIWFKFTRTPFSPPEKISSLIGIHKGTAYYLIRGELTRPIFETLPAFDGAKIIFGDTCRMSATALQMCGATFRQLPKAIR